MIAAVLLAAAPETSAAADDPMYLTEYRAYRAAIEAGDTSSAARHGFLAWRSAEAERGDDRLTAILAFNYGRTVLFLDAAAAARAFERVAELPPVARAELPEDELNLYRAYAAFDTGDHGRRDTERLRVALDTYSAGEREPSPEYATIRLKFALGEFGAGHYDDAAADARRAEAAIRAAAAGDRRGLAMAIILEGAAVLFPVPRSLQQITDAHVEFTRARQLFGPQADLANFDPILGQAIAWDRAARAAVKALGTDDFSEHRHESAESGHGLDDPFLRGGAGSAACPRVVWAKHDPPHYPTSALRNGSLGAVLIGYDIAADRSLENVAILGEVPSNVFSGAALDAVRHWEVKEFPGDDPRCRRNRLASLHFTTGN